MERPAPARIAGQAVAAGVHPADGQGAGEPQAVPARRAVGHRALRVAAAHGDHRGRDLPGPVGARGFGQPPSGAGAADDGQSAARKAHGGLVGHLWVGQRVPRPARICRAQDGQLDTGQHRQLDQRVPAFELPGRLAAQRGRCDSASVQPRWRHVGHAASGPGLDPGAQPRTARAHRGPRDCGTHRVL